MINLLSFKNLQRICSTKNSWYRFFYAIGIHESAFNHFLNGKINNIRGVYLCLIFEMSIWEFITKLKKNRFRIKLDFFFEFELDFYCLCSLQKSISKSNWFFNFLNLIFRNWKKKIKWHSIFQKSSGDRQGVCLVPCQ